MDLSTFPDHLQKDVLEKVVKDFVARARNPNEVGPPLNARLDEGPSDVFIKRAEEDAEFHEYLEAALIGLLADRATDPDTRMVPRAMEPEPNAVTHEACWTIRKLELTGTWKALLGWLERHWPSCTTERAEEDYQNVLAALALIQPKPNERLLAFWRLAWREAPGELKMISFRGLRLQSPHAAAELLPTLLREVDRVIAEEPSLAGNGFREHLLRDFWNQEDGAKVLHDALETGLSAREAWAVEALEALKKGLSSEEYHELPPVV